jgi:RNA-directed DNA polymerase
MGLSLSPTKTRITHTLVPYQGHVGFDFLGFTMRQFPVGKTQTGKTPQGKPLGFKTLIKPSKEAVKRHTLTIKGQLRRLRSASQEEVIKDLNPIIWGWAAYYKTASSSRTFKRCDHILWEQLMCWARVRHRETGIRWVVEKYCYRVGKCK